MCAFEVVGPCRIKVKGKRKTKFLKEDFFLKKGSNCYILK